MSFSETAFHRPWHMKPCEVWATLRAPSRVTACTGNSWHTVMWGGKDASEPGSTHLVGSLPLQGNPSLHEAGHRIHLSDSTVGTPSHILAVVHGWIQKPLGDLPSVPLNHSKLSQLQLLWGLRLSGQRSLQIKKYKLWVSVLTLLSLWPRSFFQGWLNWPRRLPRELYNKDDWNADCVNRHFLWER